MLTDSKVKGAQPGDKRYFLQDVEGLVLEVMVSGNKIWRQRLQAGGKRKMVTIGEYPRIGLREARDLAHDLRSKMREGAKLEMLRPTAVTFTDMAQVWADAHDRVLSTHKGMATTRQRLNNHVIPFIGDKDITEITPQDILFILQRLASLEKFDMMTRCRSLISQVFRYAAANGHPVFDPTAVLKGAIIVPKVKHMASLQKKDDVARLMQAIDAYPKFVIRRAMLFSAYTFCRPGEIRHAEWSEIDFEKAEWRIPAEKMKMRRVHIVPLARQVLTLLDELRPGTGDGKYVFPNVRATDGSRPMSEAAVLVALRSMGFGKDEMTAHGFRSMASTILNENGFNSDWIERQLAHVEGNKVRAAYNYADYLEDRRKMMQWYADYLDGLKK